MKKPKMRICFVDKKDPLKSGYYLIPVELLDGFQVGKEEFEAGVPEVEGQSSIHFDYNNHYDVSGC